MKIELNKTYHVSNKWKKSVLEINTLENEMETAIVETVWRWGEFEITPGSVSEVNELQRAVDDDEYILNSRNFSDWELNETSDGDMFDPIVSDAIIEEYEDDIDDYASLIEFLEDAKDFEYTDTVFEISNGVDVIAWWNKK